MSNGPKPPPNGNVLRAVGVNELNAGRNGPPPKITSATNQIRPTSPPPPKNEKS